MKDNIFAVFSNKHLFKSQSSNQHARALRFFILETRLGGWFGP